jgi:primosomal protein N' (replication factor Y)
LVQRALFLAISRFRLYLLLMKDNELNFTDGSQPRYHALHAAIVLQINLEQSFARSNTWYWKLTSINRVWTSNHREIHGNVLMPEVQVDLKDKYFRKKRLYYAWHLMPKPLPMSLDEQVYFQNRRGHSPYWVYDLDTHNASTMFRLITNIKNQLRCHYCGYSQNQHIAIIVLVWFDNKGFGEQIQQRIRALTPQTKIGRMDQDTTRGKYGFEK